MALTKFQGPEVHSGLFLSSWKVLLDDWLQYAVPQGQGEAHSSWKGERERKKGKKEKSLKEPSGYRQSPRCGGAGSVSGTTRTWQWEQNKTGRAGVGTQRRWSSAGHGRATSLLAFEGTASGAGQRTLRI